MVEFGTLHPDGTLAHVRAIRQASLAACPFTIFDPSHYRADESCKCNDPAEQAKMVREWGYRPSDFRRAGIEFAAPKGRVRLPDAVRDRRRGYRGVFEGQEGKVQS